MKYIMMLIMLCSFVSLGATLQVDEIQAKNVFTGQHQIKKVLLVVAMDSEAEPMIKTLNLKPSTHVFYNSPVQGYSGQYKNKEIFLILNGKDSQYKVQNVGTQAATLTTYLGIAYFHPDLVISIGTAGGIAEQKVKIGDVFVSQKNFFCDRRIPIPGYKEYGLGGYSSANFDAVIQKVNLKQGIVCTGDSFDNNKTDYEIMLKTGCSVKEMESAGVAWVSMVTKTPMIAMKGITDLVGSKNETEDFAKNFTPVVNHLALKLKDFLSLV